MVGKEGSRVPSPLTAPTFQITAQELSDNRVITLSLAGRKLDKKVSQSERAPINNSKPSPAQGARVCFFWPHHFHFPWRGSRLSTEPLKSGLLPLWESALPLRGRQTMTRKPLVVAPSHAPAEGSAVVLQGPDTLLRPSPLTTWLDQTLFALLSFINFLIVKC